MESTFKKNLVAIGGSAGSGAVLRQIVAGLPANLPASVFVTTHLPASASNFLIDMLGSVAPMPIGQAVDGQPIEQGRIYIAARDRHLLLIGDTIRLGVGPRENMARPAIDAMFRSAALAGGSRVIGVVLSGMLNDGAAGLAAIKARGGTTIVQHPIDAQVDQMPRAALDVAEIDYVARADDLARTIISIVGSDAGASPAIADALRLEVEIAAGARLGRDNLLEIAEPSALSCPDCHGVLSELRDARPLRYRCQIGHAFTAEVLAARIEELDEAIKVAMRIMEERVTLVERMARDARETGRSAVAELYEGRAIEYQRYAATLRHAASSSLRQAVSGEEI